MENKRNLIIFVLISILILFGYSNFFNKSNSVKTSINEISNQQNLDNKQTSIGNVDLKPIVIPDVKPKDIRIDSKNIRGVIVTKGAKINNIILKKYKNDNKDGEVSVFGAEEDNYYAYSGWKSSDQPTPNESTIWSSDDSELTPEKPITLTWNNGYGLVFEKKISIDNDYLLTINDSVKNISDKNIEITSITKIHQIYKNKEDKNWSSYQGPIGYLNGKLKEISYEDIAKSGVIKEQITGGWFGITDKYWLVTFLPSENAANTITYSNKDSSYMVESNTPIYNLNPSVEISNTYNLFVGAKEINILDMYEKKLNVKHFDLAIDFGRLYFITKPLLYSLVFIKDLVGNMGLAIILLTLLIKLLLLPLANKSYRSMNRMKEIQPKIQAIQKKYASDKIKLGQEVSALYKKENVSPAGGCLPTLLQSPILFALYKVLYISIEMRHAPFIWWIQDLSMPDTMYLLNLFGLIPINLPGFLQIGIWPLLMGLTMFWQQKMSPAPADPAQEKMMMLMPLMFMFMFAQLPSGLVIYWTFSNVLSIAQQYYINKIETRKKAK